MTTDQKTLPSDQKTLPYPWGTEGHPYNPDQVMATAEHVLEIPGWVSTEKVIELVGELLELASDEDAVDEVSGTRFGDDETAARYALLATRLIDAYELKLGHGHVTT